MRRSLGPTQPMWLVHIDGSYGEDAQKCIDAIPADVKPYVVFNIAMTKAENYSYITNALNVCKQNGVWAMVQPSSGSRNSMSNTDIAGYEQLYQTYPNLIGFNFCEQNWFETAEEFVPRLELFCKLMELGNKYGGYLYVNDSQSISNANRNTIAKMKSYARYAACSKRYADNFIYGDKTTMGYGYYDNESACLGMYLSGHAGNYAIRYDQYSWSYSGHGQVFGTETSGAYEATLAWFSCPEALMGISIVEHLMLQGATVIDGPEVPIVTCLFDGQQTPSFKNMICDILRRVIDGTITIPSRTEVLARTKMALAINNTAYTVPDEANIYDGLYQMDGSRNNNKTWLKRSGRYPSIPTVATAADAAAITANYVALSGDNLYSDRWTDNNAKVAWFNEQYPVISTGDMYVARISNGIYAYNPYINTDQNAQASIPFKFNTCNSLELEYTPHTFSVVKESATGLKVYLNNYRTDKNSYWSGSAVSGMTQTTLQTTYLKPFIASPNDGTLRTSTIKVTGCSEKPTARWKDRGSHSASSCYESYEDGTWTLTINHNGPVDIEITCQGSATGRETAPTPASVGTICQPTTAPMHDHAAYAYDFESYSEGDAYGCIAGTVQVVTQQGSKMLNPQNNGSGTNKIGVTTLGQFGVESNYSVTWKEYTTSATKGGMLLRGIADYEGGNPGVLSGYFFQTTTSITNKKTDLAIRKLVNSNDGTTGSTSLSNLKTGSITWTDAQTSVLRWYRATVNGSTLTFEYSDDGTDFTVGATCTDETFASAGVTQLLWGLNTNVKTSYYDDVTMTPATAVPANEDRTDYAGAADPEASVSWTTVTGQTSVSVTVPAAGYTSFSSTYPLDFTGSGVKAYVVASADTDNSLVYLSEVTSVPAHTGLLLKASKGTYSVNIANGAPLLTGDNLLKATSEESHTVTAAEAGHVYILARQNEVTGFYTAASGLTVPVGYAYLYLPTPSEARMLSFGDATGINTVQSLKFKVQSYYDLQGRRINAPSRGLYITNGKKVIVK